MFNENCTTTVANNARFTTTKTNEYAITNSWSVDLFPNPTVSEVNIVSKTEKENLNIIITDISGKVLVVKNLTTTNFITTLDLSLNNGIYLVTITNTKNEKTTKKLVITK